MKYLKGYPQELQDQVRLVISQGQLANGLRTRYPNAHGVRTDKALYDYVTGLKNQYIRNGAPISKVSFDSKIQVIAHALGTHATISRVQGKNLKSKREIRIATLFRTAPDEFLKMIAVHELAHLKESEHNKSFYQLCLHMEPNYYQYEFDVRLYLTHLDQSDGVGLWDVG